MAAGGESLMARVAHGLPEASHVLARFIEALDAIDLDAWSRDNEPHALLAERLAALEPDPEAVETVVGSITRASGHGDLEETGDVGYVHHRSFRQQLRLEPRESETT
jgi:hypothetical protein